MIRRYSISIYGQVQGIFFRQSAKQKADELDITGFARNEPDGSVYLDAAGQEKNIQEFITWCHVGPEHAQVTKVDVRELEPPRRLDGFIF